MRAFMRAFKTAVHLMTRFQPAEAQSDDYAKVLTCIPAVGALLGLGLWVAAAALLNLAGEAAGSLVGAACLPVLYWWVTGGRGLSGLIALIETRFPDTDRRQATTEVHGLYWRLSAFQGMVIIKLLLTGLILYCGHLPWLLVAPVLGAAVFAELCVPGDKAEQAVSARWGHWIVAAAAVLIVTGLMGAFVAGLFSLVIAYLAAPGIESLLRGAESDENGKRAVMEAVELLTLILGLLYFLGTR